MHDPAELIDPGEVARFLADYAKRYHAGAFATPLAKELPGRYETFTDARGARTAIVGGPATSTSRRTDWRGEPFEVPRGARVATHVARDPGAELPPPLAADHGVYGWDLVCTYVEDADLTDGLAAAGWVRVMSQITAAAEVKAWWAPAGAQRERTAPWDEATVTIVPPVLFGDHLAAAVRSLADVTTWADDFPYYSDGSWGAVSLRGFWPEDPGRGVKPSEMPRKWKLEHPDDLAREADWTSAAALVPDLVDWVEAVPWWERLERVRLLRMAGTGQGALGRHTDITDRAAGTRDDHVVRFHVPLITDPAIRLTTWDLDGVERAHHLAQGQTYYLDARKPHAVANPTTVDRVHLVVDVLADDDVRSVLAASRKAPTS